MFDDGFGGSNNTFGNCNNFAAPSFDTYSYDCSSSFDSYTPQLDPMAYVQFPGGTGVVFDPTAVNAGVGFANMSMAEHAAAVQLSEDNFRRVSAVFEQFSLPARQLDADGWPELTRDDVYGMTSDEHQAYLQARDDYYRENQLYDYAPEAVLTRKNERLVEEARKSCGYVGYIDESGWCCVRAVERYDWAFADWKRYYQFMYRFYEQSNNKDRYYRRIFRIRQRIVDKFMPSCTELVLPYIGKAYYDSLCDDAANEYAHLFMLHRASVAAIGGGQ
ncbi:hypothetical protein FP568_09565 [Pandoraea pnomenusa]|uniref:hypothetical protein n=1 Tax=Pandoraea pnomenusa TaxID=93220 RepID=UPI0011987B5A|nr:hypothetical protein [Pandoraea pnomenusa]QDX21473.1 hypothetical protein FP568_09565 [Pandoraea pnomenusa]